MLTIRKLAIASVSLLALATPAMAQDAVAEGAVAENVGDEYAGYGDIVVQARRRDESVQDVPAVVNAVTSASLEKLNLRRLEDVASVVPGLSLASNSNGIGSTTSMRGVQHDVIASGDAGTVQYYYNEAPVSSGVVLQGLYDIELVEVLRGPQGTLKGRAAPSGSISITFRRPDLDEVGGYAMGTVNDINGYNINGAMNLPIIDGKLGLRVAGLVSDDDGNDVHALTNSRELKNSTEAARISLRADPFDGVFLVDASYSTMTSDVRQYTQVESMNQFGDGFDASPTTIRAKDRLAVNRIPLEVRSRIENYNVNAQLNAYGQRLVYVGNWARQSFTGTDSSRAGDRAGLFENPYGPLLDRNGAAVGGIVPFTQPNATRGDTDTHELRLQNEDRVAGMFDYVVGFLSYKIDSPTNFSEVGGAVPNADGTLAGVVLVPLQRFNNSEEKSVFGNITAHIGDRAELSGGVRHIWYKTDAGVRGCDVAFATCVDIPDLATPDDLRKQEATIFSVSGKYEFTDNLMGYVSYGTSWRPSTVVIGGPTAPSEAQRQFLGSDPEKSKSVEAGIKSSWLNNRLRLNVTGFYQEFDNYAYRAPGAGVYARDFSSTTQPVRAYNFISAVPVEVKGIEADLSFAVTPNWSISGNAAYADGKIKNGTIACLDLDGDGVPDPVTDTPEIGDMNPDGISACQVTQRANASSPWNFTIQSEYSRPLSANVDGFLRGLYTWKGNAFGDPQNVYDSVDAYGLLNLYAGVRDPNGAWEIMAYGKNVTNTFRVLTRSNGPETTNLVGVGPVSTNYFAITATQPQEFGITARFAFGSR